MSGDDKVVKNQDVVTLYGRQQNLLQDGGSSSSYTWWECGDVGRLQFNHVGGDGDGRQLQWLSKLDEYILVVETV